MLSICPLWREKILRCIHGVCTSSSASTAQYCRIDSQIWSDPTIPIPITMISLFVMVSKSCVIIIISYGNLIHSYNRIYPDDANAATVLSSGIAAIDHDAFGYEDGGFGLFTWRRSRHFSASCFIGMPRYKQRYQDCA